MPLSVVLSNTAGVPIYEQIAQQVRDAILTGQVEADEMLPSIRALARDLRVSVITTTRAYSDLVAEGFLANVPGKGYFSDEELHTMLQTIIATSATPATSKEKQ